MGVRPALPKSRTFTALATGVVVSALVTGGGLAIAAMPSTATGDITSCVNASTGAIRVIDYEAGKRCSSSEHQLSWSKGFRFRGAWSASSSYAVKDLVTYQGSTYLARTTSSNVTPGSTGNTAWVVLAAKGADGAMGPQGAKGDTGAQGAKGDTGAAGKDGVNGTNGVDGKDGAQGAKGDTGAQGAKGDTGAQGAKGDTGAAGKDGANGTNGTNGTNGVDGAKGDTGAQGAKGDTGAAGKDGVNGKDGAQGAKGDRGSLILSGSGAPAAGTGVDGDYYLDTATFTLYGPKTAGSWTGTGLVLKGAKGDKGDTGAQGPKGDTGATGAVGPKGATGATGATGPAGPQGPEGPATPELFTSSLSVNGLNATGGPAFDYDGQTSGCWGAVVGRNDACVDKYASALMAGRNDQVSNLYVRAPGIDLKDGEWIKVSVIVGSSPAKMGNGPSASDSTDYTKFGLSCTLTKVAGAQPNCEIPGLAAQAFPGLSGYFVGLQVTTNVQSPLKGQVFTTFELV